jgi:hypothetical protein
VLDHVSLARITPRRLVAAERGVLDRNHLTHAALAERHLARRDRLVAAAGRERVAETEPVRCPPEALAKLPVRAAVARHVQLGVADAVERHEQPDPSQVPVRGPPLRETATAEPAQLALVAAAMAEAPLSLEPDELHGVGQRSTGEHARHLEQERAPDAPSFAPTNE